MLHRGDLSALARACAERGVRLVSDEIYHGITYGPAAVTALSLDDEVIVVNSFSKYYSMTGWRLGWMVVPPALLRPIECLAQNLFISPPALSQMAAIEAFASTDELNANVARYARNRDILVDAMPRAGLARFAAAEGAFYLYANIQDLGRDSTTLSRQLLGDIGVALTPGVDFDPRRGHDFIRLSYAGATADVEEAARRLIEWRRRSRP